MIATADYYNSTYDGTGNITIGRLFITNQNVIRSTDINGNFPDCNYQNKWNKLYYYNGLAFDTDKKAKAYGNMIKSRETAKKLSFFTPDKIYREPEKIKIKFNALSIKQRAYNKRKKHKERLGLKH